MSKKKTTRPQDPVTKQFISEAKAKQIEEFEDTYGFPEPQARATTASVAPEPAAAVTASPAPPPVSKHLARRADRLGMKPEDYADMDADRLEEVVWAREQERAESRDRELSQFKQQWASPNDFQRQPAPQPQAQLAPVADEFIDEVVKGYPDLNPDLLKSLNSAVRKILKPHLEKIEKIEQGHTALLNAEGQRQERSFAEQADSFFSKHPEIYGAGKMKDLPKDSPFRQVRSLLADKVDFSDVAGSLDKMHQTFYGHIKPAAPAATPAPVAPAKPTNGVPQRGSSAAVLAERQKQWDEGTIAAPVPRHEPVVNGKDAAVAGIREILDRADTRNDPEAEDAAFIE